MMFTIEQILRLMTHGLPLPQSEHPAPSDEQIDELQTASEALLAKALHQEAPEVVERQIDELCDRYGWFITAGVLGMTFAQCYNEDQVFTLAPLSDDVETLLVSFAVAAAAESTDEGAWTIPVAMLASAEEGLARNFVAAGVLVACCALVEQQ
ncbi:hypothetical protein [Streptomyces cucumeris]|uniref:hypothetical protein n=1 Tax=Streptomyces cucumeris TaxID=2962890 RepID=UPI0020C8C85E|nr:hypothetical protein [Streptomyces sp. NEAU-Y11]MCP9209610.1 hypothetical protein [Streptomyces sp. NEAU-Y11]